MANFKPPANVASLGSYCCVKNLATLKNTVYLDKMLLFWPSALALPDPFSDRICFLRNGFLSKKNFSPFCLASPEIIGIKFGNRQTDKFFDTIYGGMRIFSFVKCAISLLALGISFLILWSLERFGKKCW